MGLTVGSSRDRLAKQTERLLEPGECIVAEAKCLPRGAGKRRAVGQLFLGVIGAVAAGSTARSGPVFGRPLPGNLALAVTNRRLLVLRLSEARDKVAELTHSVPLGQVTEVRSGVGKSVGLKAVHIALSFADGSTASLEVVRPNTKDGEDVARALSVRVGPIPSSG